MADHKIGSKSILAPSVTVKTVHKSCKFRAVCVTCYPFDTTAKPVLGGHPFCIVKDQGWQTGCAKENEKYLRRMYYAWKTACNVNASEVLTAHPKQIWMYEHQYNFFVWKMIRDGRNRKNSDIF